VIVVTTEKFPDQNGLTRLCLAWANTHNQSWVDDETTANSPYLGRGGATCAMSVDGGPPAAPGALGPRETEVLRLLASGKRNREIGAELVRAVRTLESTSRT
jgi:DNA-binding NarL/FixJ family response regulator